MNAHELQAQLDCLKASRPIAHEMERGGRMTWFPDLDGAPEWAVGKFLSYPTEREAIRAAKDKQTLLVDHLQRQIDDQKENTTSK